MRTIQGICIGLVLVLVSPLAATYFQEPRVTVVLWVLSVCIVFAGASNMGMTLAQKDLNFSLEFRQQVLCKLLAVVTTIASAYLLGDYRALVIGVATGYGSGWLTSYWMHPYRPRWNLSRIPEIWALTKWMMIGGIGGFILRKSDELIASRIGTTREYGLYNVGADLGQLPTGELGPAMLRALLPVLSSIQGDVRRTNDAVLKTLAAANTLTFPVGFGFAAIAVPATELILGAQWAQAAQYVALFSLAGAAQFAVSPLNTLLVLYGHTRVQSRVVWLEFAVFATSSLALVPHFHLLGLVMGRILASLISAGATLIITQKYCHLQASSVTATLFRPLVGAVAMAVGVAYLLGQVPPGFLPLLFCVACGAILYSVWCLFSWLTFGKPQGLESTVVDYFLSRNPRQAL